MTWVLGVHHLYMHMLRVSFAENLITTLCYLIIMTLEHTDDLLELITDVNPEKDTGIM